jgi:hypothetical protein
MKRVAVSALRTKGALRPVRLDAEPQVVGLGLQTTIVRKGVTIKTCLLLDPSRVEPQKLARLVGAAESPVCSFADCRSADDPTTNVRRLYSEPSRIGNPRYSRPGGLRYFRSCLLRLRRGCQTPERTTVACLPGPNPCRIVDEMRRSAIIFVFLAVASFLTADAWAAPPAKDEVIPLIEMEKVPLTDAIRQFARQAHLNILLDPRLSAAPFNSMTISIRWENVTAREALLALLDNYGLELVESPRSVPSR